MTGSKGSGSTAGLGFDLTNKTLSNQDVNQYLGQSSTANPLLDLANEIQGASGTAAARGTAAYGGGAGSPVLQSNPAGGRTVGWLPPSSGGGSTAPPASTGLPTTSPGGTPVTGNPGGIVLGGSPVKVGTSGGTSVTPPPSTGGVTAPTAAALGGSPVKSALSDASPSAGSAPVSSGGVAGQATPGYTQGPYPGTVVGPDGQVYGLPGVG